MPALCFLASQAGTYVTPGQANSPWPAQLLHSLPPGFLTGSGLMAELTNPAGSAELTKSAAQTLAGERLELLLSITSVSLHAHLLK